MWHVGKKVLQLIAITTCTAAITNTCMRLTFTLSGLCCSNCQGNDLQILPDFSMAIETTFAQFHGSSKTAQNLGNQFWWWCDLAEFKSLLSKNFSSLAFNWPAYNNVQLHEVITRCVQCGRCGLNTSMLSLTICFITSALVLPLYHLDTTTAEGHKHIPLPIHW